MARRIKLTEEQVNMLREEGIPTFTANSDDNASVAVQKATQDLKGAGINPDTVNIQIPAKKESKIITKKSIYENRLKALKKNSTVYSLRDFMKK